LLSGFQRLAAENCDNTDVFQNVNDWSNDMAKGMMSIQQEVEAFGETMPEPQYNKTPEQKGKNKTQSEDD